MFQSGFGKLILIGVIIFLAVKFHDVFFEYLVESSDATKKIATKFELSRIQNQIFTDHTENHMQFTSFRERDWHEYIRKNNSDPKKKRDPSKDLWGTPLQILSSSSTPGQQKPGVTIRSAGVDKKFSTNDDILVFCELSPEY